MNVDRKGDTQMPPRIASISVYVYDDNYIRVDIMSTSKYMSLLTNNFARSIPVTAELVEVEAEVYLEAEGNVYVDVSIN